MPPVIDEPVSTANRLGGEAGRGFPSESPAGFDPENPRKDPHAYLEQKEHLVRQNLLAVETAKVRDKENGLGLPIFHAGP